MTYKIVFVRHGESEWNKLNQFCGWVDADLSPKGLEEAKAGGVALKNDGYKFDVAFTSVLKRANKTLEIALNESGNQDCPVEKTWRLKDLCLGSHSHINTSQEMIVYDRLIDFLPHRTSLWRPDRPQQSGNRRKTRRRTSPNLAKILQHAPSKNGKRPSLLRLYRQR